ncbi:MAG: hypothetical protein ABIM99_00820 [Candidatus Dojkabacteria bacterium]
MLNQHQNQQNQSELFDPNSNYFKEKARMQMSESEFGYIRRLMISYQEGVYTWQEVAHVFTYCRSVVDEVGAFNAIEKARSGERALRGFNSLYPSIGDFENQTEKYIDTILRRFFSEEQRPQILLYCGGYPALSSMPQEQFNNLIIWFEQNNDLAFEEKCNYVWGNRGSWAQMN